MVIDRDSRRYKKDKDVRKAGFKIERQKFDIADFDLAKYTSIHNKEKTTTKIVGIAKHLCGGATDLALTSYKKLDESQLDGMSMATCCHHTCDNKTYVNLPFIKQELGIGALQFNEFVKCSSWAFALHSNWVTKRKAGFKLKRLLDLGRLLFIRQMGFFPEANIRAVQYCNCATESPESTLILATKTKAQN